MTKQELVAKIAEEAGITQKAAAKALEAFVGAVKDAVAAGDKVALLGFGTFEARQRAARTARNPQNPKEVIKVEAKIVPAFKAGKGFKEAVVKKCSCKCKK